MRRLNERPTRTKKTHAYLFFPVGKSLLCNLRLPHLFSNPEPVIQLTDKEERKEWSALRYGLSHYMSRKDIKRHFLETPNTPLMIWGTQDADKSAVVNAILRNANYSPRTIGDEERTSKGLRELLLQVQNPPNPTIMALFGVTTETQAIIFDDIHTLNQRGRTTLHKILDEAKIPVILICENPDDDKCAELAKKCKVIELKRTVPHSSRDKS